MESMQYFNGCMITYLQGTILKYYNFLSTDPLAILIFFLLINEILVIDQIVNKQQQLKLQNHRFLKNIWSTISQSCPVGLCLFNQNNKRIEFHNAALESLLGVQTVKNSQLVEQSYLRIKKRQIKIFDKGEPAKQKQDSNKNPKKKTKSLLQIIIDLVEEINLQKQSHSIVLEEMNNILFRFNVVETNKNIIIQFRNITLEKTNYSIVTFLPIDQIQQIEFNKQLQRFDQQYTSSVAYDLLNPLNHIKCINLLFLNNMKQIQHIKQSETLYEQQEILQLAVENMENLISNMIDLTLIRTSKFKFKNTTFSLRKELENIIKTQQVQTQIKGLKLKLKIDKNVPNFIHSDLQRIKQILITLLQNAIKFTDKGYVYLHCKPDQEQPIHHKQTDKQQTNNYPDIQKMRQKKASSDANKNEINLRNLIFTVRDTGQGINSQDIEKLFRLFGQVQSAKKVNQSGVGLGLAICKQLVEQFMGKLKVDSIFGIGSKFSFSILVQDVSDQIEASTFEKKIPNFLIRQFVSLQSNFEDESPTKISVKQQSIFNDESKEFQEQQQNIYEGEQQNQQEYQIRRKTGTFNLHNLQELNFVVEDKNKRSSSVFYNKARRRNTLRQLNNEISEIIHGLKKIDKQHWSNQKDYGSGTLEKSNSLGQGQNQDIQLQQYSQNAQNSIIRDLKSMVNSYYQSYQQINNPNNAQANYPNDSQIPNIFRKNQEPNFDKNFHEKYYQRLSSQKKHSLTNCIFKEIEEDSRHTERVIQDKECEVECSFDKPNPSNSFEQNCSSQTYKSLDQNLKQSQVFQINKKMLNKNKLNQRSKINQLIKDQLKQRRQSYVIFEAPDELGIDTKHKNKKILKKFPNLTLVESTPFDQKNYLQVDQKLILTQGQIPKILSQSSFTKNRVLSNNLQPKKYYNEQVPQIYDVHQITISKFTLSDPSEPNSNLYPDPQTEQNQRLTTMQSVSPTLQNHIIVQQKFIYSDQIQLKIPNFEQVPQQNQQKKAFLSNSSELKIMIEGTNMPYQNNYYQEIPINNQIEQDEDQQNYNLNNIIDKNLRNLTPNEILKLKHKIILNQKTKQDSGNKLSDYSQLQNFYPDKTMNQLHQSSDANQQMTNSQTIQDFRNKFYTSNQANSKSDSVSSRSESRESASTQNFKSSLGSESHSNSHSNNPLSQPHYPSQFNQKKSSSSVSDGTHKKFEWQNQIQEQEIVERKIQKIQFKFTRTPSTIAALNSDQIMNLMSDKCQSNVFPVQDNQEDNYANRQQSRSVTSQFHQTQVLEQSDSSDHQFSKIANAYYQVYN